MIRAHKQAILDRLRQDTVLTDSTFEGVVADRPQRYCTVFTDSGLRTVERVTGPSMTATFTYTVHSVGTTPEQAQAVAERVFAQLLDFRPSVVGRRCGRLRHAVSQPVQQDFDIPDLYYCVDQFDLTSDPA